MRVLVTGSEGFVGKHVVDALKERGDMVWYADKQDGYDLAKPDDVEAAWPPPPFEPDAVIHLASSCSTPGSVVNPVQTFRDTVQTAVNVLEMARKHKTPVLLTSSVKARDGMTPYGTAKRMVELWALEYFSAYQLPVVINRPGTIYGPGQEGSPESGWIAWFLEAKRLGQSVTVNGSGEQVRDLLHVSDYVRLLLLQLDDIQEYMGYYIWDVGGGQENAVSVNQVVEFLDLTVDSGPTRYGDAEEYIGLNNVAGWSPTVPWRAGLSALL